MGLAAECPDLVPQAAPLSHLLLLNGPNLNLLGTREPQVYGSTTLAEIEADLGRQAQPMGHRLSCFQSNHEGELVDRVQAARSDVDFILLNPGAYTHTSIALHDAIRAIGPVPVIEVHLSNVHAREPFRHVSMVSPVAAGVILGLGPHGYVLALEALANRS